MYKAKVKLKSGIVTFLTFNSKSEMVSFEEKGHTIIRAIEIKN
jgi:hypothetical protein